MKKYALLPMNISHVLVFADTQVSTTFFDVFGEEDTHWLETILPWNHQDKVDFLKDFWYKPLGFIRTNTFPTNWDAFHTILDADLATREEVDCIHCGEPVVNMMRYMRKHAATCSKLKHFQQRFPLHNYLCPKCNETCKRNLTIEVHLKYNHYCKENNETEEFHCDQCNYTVFPDMERLHYHRRLHYYTPVFKRTNDTHTIPWTVSFKDILPHLYNGTSQERYEQDMSTDELDVLLERPELFDEGSLAVEQYLEKEKNDSLEVRKLILSGNTQWQIDIMKKYENMTTAWLSTRSWDQVMEKNRKHYMDRRKEAGYEIDYFDPMRYTNKYTVATLSLENSEYRRKYAAAHDWNKTRQEAFEYFDEMQQYRKYSILCHFLSKTPTTTEPRTYDYETSDYSNEKIECSHYSPPSKESEEKYDPKSKDWKFTPL
ncbi:hypothetical protein M8J76_005694 [Diaphorina citri]|jgi:hypothetical protein|nr:hypothetical protein M8J75_014948 [Diaphorina citri]KAI5740631.1 hypothetical protein M8J76_005694 [Diaphorina citri]KAI5748023.1 hypothetical protein M8J77_021058 [Diaphorina citri]